MKKCYYWWKSKTIEKKITFDMGPSWYWMPDVFDRFFGKKTTDYYELIKLSPCLS
jgi:phytoene dehydrogenase-like protein